MTVVSFDIGNKNIGVAVSDNTDSIALPVETVKYESPEKLLEYCENLKDKYKADSLVIGLPVSLNQDNEQPVENFAICKMMEKIKLLVDNIGIPVYYQDERFTSASAHKTTMFEEIKSKNRKYSKTKIKIKIKKPAPEKIDMIAATYILQSFLDKRRQI
ncbi:MAG TPA: Holliday junction resolvase RuvX [bacterium]|nr:Holliday junction resolvase RuvX [bacterium]HPN31545.1 Holliday junction resolvase RuvX [bacterium]